MTFATLSEDTEGESSYFLIRKYAILCKQMLARALGNCYNINIFLNVFFLLHLQLKQEDFIITNTSEAAVVKNVMASIILKEQELKDTIDEAHLQIDVKRAEFRSEVEAKLRELDERLSAGNDSSQAIAVSDSGNTPSNTVAGSVDTLNTVDNRSVSNTNMTVTVGSQQVSLFAHSHFNNSPITIIQQFPNQ